MFLSRFVKGVLFFNVRYTKGVPFVNGRYTNGVSFLPKMVYERVRGRRLPVEAILGSTPPPPPHRGLYLLLDGKSRFKSFGRVVLTNLLVEFSQVGV